LLDIEKRPIERIATVGVLCVLAGTLVVSVPLQQGENGVSMADEALCRLMPGEVCNAVARLTGDEQEKLRFIMLACEGGVTERCQEKGREQLRVDAGLAVRLFRASCEGGAAGGCTVLGLMYENGLGVEADAARAVELYEQGCDGGDTGGMC
jgi:TPR repeat protein